MVRATHRFRQFPVPSADLMHYLISKGRHCSYMRLDLAEPIDFPRLVMAVRRLLERHPILCCKFVEHAWQPAWVWTSPADIPVSRYCVYKELSSETEVEEDLLQTSVDATNPPLVRVILYRHPDGDTLCLKKSHAVADGVGTQAIAQQLADLYGDPEQVESISEAERFKAAANRSCRLLARSLTATHCRRAILRLVVAHVAQLFRKTASFPSSWAFPDPLEADSGRHEWISASFSRDETIAMRDLARCLGAALNDLVLAAFYVAAGKLGHAWTSTSWGLTISLNLRLPRDEPPNGWPLCNLISSATLRVTTPPSADATAILAEIVLLTSAAKAARAACPHCCTAVAILESAPLGSWTTRLIPFRVLARRARRSVSGRSHTEIGNSINVSYMGDMTLRDGRFGGVSITRQRSSVDSFYSHSLFASTASDCLSLSRVVDGGVLHLPTARSLISETASVLRDWIGAERVALSDRLELTSA